MNPVRQPLPDTALLRLPAVLQLIPVSRSTWWAMCRDGRGAQPVKIGKRCTAWRAEDIYKLIDAASSGKEAA